MFNHIKVPGFEHYLINQDGVIKSLCGREIQAVAEQKYNHPRRVSLKAKNNKCRIFTISHLVAETFLPKIEGFNEINYIDSNPANFKLSNLRWAPQRHGVQNLGQPKIKVKCINTGVSFDSYSAASRWAGFQPSRLGLYFKHNYKYAGHHPKTGEQLRWELVD